MSGQDLDQVKRWAAKRKTAVVLDLIKGKTNTSDVARKHDLTAAEVEGWVDRFLSASCVHFAAAERESAASSS